MIASATYCSYNAGMIKKYVNGNPLDIATENYLLVPVAAETSRMPDEGFVVDVIKRHIGARASFECALHSQFGMGDVLITDRTDDAPYEIVFAALHRHGAGGWKEAPEALSSVLESLPDVRGPNVSVATAGIPGTGLSGLKGGADINAIKGVLEVSPKGIVVYTRKGIIDREPRTLSDPLPQDSIAL